MIPFSQSLASASKLKKEPEQILTKDTRKLLHWRDVCRKRIYQLFSSDIINTHRSTPFNLFVSEESFVDNNGWFFVRRSLASLTGVLGLFFMKLFCLDERFSHFGLVEETLIVFAVTLQSGKNEYFVLLTSLGSSLFAESPEEKLTLEVSENFYNWHTDNCSVNRQRRLYLPLLRTLKRARWEHKCVQISAQENYRMSLRGEVTQTTTLRFELSPLVERSVTFFNLRGNVWLTSMSLVFSSVVARLFVFLLHTAFNLFTECFLHTSFAVLSKYFFLTVISSECSKLRTNTPSPID